ncbi:MAG: 6,7-dimethyl-8-ribityllumazine synthase [Ilumatobacteraceae bacterium]|jgi:6,7-dimethyl-8-ribityllumazine synthase|nr:6,7-dimethyl-8-ribityllumazine synthase [Ilumatobacteraceae bacterium]
MTVHHGRPDGTGRRFALVCSRFNDLIVTRLEHGARDVLVRHGVADDAIDSLWVPGAWEIPIVAKAVAETGRYDAVVGLGAVMRGATYHFEIVANHSAAGLARVALDTGVVVTNGIVTVDTMDQALERAGSKAGNKGADAALAALETVDLLHRVTSDS